MGEVIRNIDKQQEQIENMVEADFVNEKFVLLVDKRMFMVASSAVTCVHIITCALEVNAQGDGDIPVKQVCMVLNVAFCTEYFMEWIHRFRWEGKDAFNNKLHVIDTIVIGLSAL